MVRTASTAVRASGGKSTKAVAKSGGSALNASSSGGNERPGGSGNTVHPRETPSWQKPISSFFKRAERKGAAKASDVDMMEVGVGCAAGAGSSSITTRDIAEAGSSKDIYRLRNVHIDNNNDDEAGLNNNNGSYNNNNNNNVLDHNTPQPDTAVSDDVRSESATESMDIDISNPGTSGYQVKTKEEEAGSSGKDKENLDDNKQAKKRIQDQVVVDNPPKKLKPEFYKYLEEFESVDR